MRLYVDYVVYTTLTETLTLPSRHTGNSDLTYYTQGYPPDTAILNVPHTEFEGTTRYSPVGSIVTQYDSSPTSALGTL